MSAFDRKSPEFAEAFAQAIVFLSYSMCGVDPTHPAFAEHVTSPSHPERPARLEAVVRATQHPALVDAVQPLVVRPASDVDLQRVHPVEHLAALRGISEAGGGWIDGDTQMSSGSCVSRTSPSAPTRVPW